nr:unnamed protein product [Spirometra erinaceieuropaei]
MFYAHFVLSKKGPLARIWLAAHWDKKLTRAHVFETNISSSVEAILEPKLKMALRTSGHLLLGVVRIYSRKAKYLLADCNEIYVKIKTAFRPGAVDLPDESNREAAIAAITLPENIQDYEATMADLTAINLNTMTINQSRPEDITMREDFGEINLGRQDDDFGDSAFNELSSREVLREGDVGFDSVYGRGTDASGRFSVRPSDRPSIRGDLDADDTLIGGSTDERGKIDKRLSGYTPARGSAHGDMDLDDGFAGALYDDDSDGSFGGEIVHSLFASPNLFEDPSAQKDLENIAASEFNTHVNATELQIQREGTLAEVGDKTTETAAGVPITSMATAEVLVHHGQKNGSLMPQVNLAHAQDSAMMVSATAASMTRTNLGKDNTTLLSNEGEAFALLPIDVTVTATEPRRAAKRKRRLIIDEQKSIPSELMKTQMQDTTDITTQLDLAPPTKRLMHMKETGSLDKLFTLPGRAIPSRILQRMFTRNLITQAIPDDLHEEHLNPTYPTQITAGVVGVTFTSTALNEDQSSFSASRDMMRTPTYQSTTNIIVQHENQGLDVIPEGTEETISSHPSDHRTFSVQQGDPNKLVHDRPFAMAGAHIGEQHADHIDQTNENIHDPFLATVDRAATRPTDIPEPASVQSDDLDDGGADFPLIDTPYLPPPSVLSEAPADVLSLEHDLAERDMRGTFGDDLIGDANLQEGAAAAASAVTAEAAEERRLEKRSKDMLRRLRAHTAQHGWSPDGLSLLAMCENNTKKQAASKFYTVLLLRKQGAVELSQDGPYSDIRIFRGPTFGGVASEA